MRIFIVGGGVAGLAVALSLARRVQTEVSTIFEQDDADTRRARRGHGLILMQNGVLALRALAADSMLQRCRALDRTELRDDRGQILETAALDGVYCVARATIVDALRAELPAHIIADGRRCARVVLDGQEDGARRAVRALEFTDGSSVKVDEGDLVIGAEGYRSRLWEALNPGVERPVSRVMEIVTSSRLPALARELGSRFVKTLFRDRGAAFGLLSPDEDRVIGFLQFDAERYTPGARQSLQEFVHAVVQDAVDPVAAYLRDADFSTAHLWRPVNAELPRHLACDNAILVGDAAHPVLPFTSQGVSAALEDAVLLGDALAEIKHAPRLLPSLLSSFASRRRTSLGPLIDGGRRLLAKFLEQTGSATAPYIDGDVSDLPRMIAIPRRVASAFFRAVDQDENGIVSEEEAQRAFRAALPHRGTRSLAAIVSALDANRDGVLTQTEFLRGLLGSNEDPLLDAARAQLSPHNIRVALELLARPASDAPDTLFSDEAVDLSVLRERAYNHRWAVHEPDVIPLTAADPDFPVAREITDALVSYLAPGYLPYGPPAGLPQWRAAAARFFTSKRSIPTDEAHIFTTDSAASGLFLAVQRALGDDGGEVIIPDPVDFLFERSILAAKGVPRRIPIRAELGSSFDLDELEKSVKTGVTKAIMICSPHNPLGRVWTRTELMALGDIAERHGLWIIADEVWSDIVFEPHAHVSIASLDEAIARRTFTVYGFSKGYGLAGLRLGVIACPSAEEVDVLQRLSHADDTAYGVSVLSQVAGIAALERAGGWQRAFVRHLRACRDESVARLNAFPGVKCTSPEGTFVAFPDVSSFGVDVDAIVEALRIHHRVAVVPGNPRFFGPGARGHLRISFATSRRVLREGLSRIGGGLQSLVRA